ncbi:50S ribosomal protein L21e [Nanoarchaeota archaeon]
MVQRIGGFRRKTRDKFKKNYRQKGKIGLSRYFQQFQDGDRVILKAESAVQKGLYHPRYHGLQGMVKGKQGNCYTVDIKDRGKKKIVIVHPVHLKKA